MSSETLHCEVPPPANLHADSHGVRYPWAEWFARGSFVLIRGTHFEGRPHGMYVTVRTAAKRFGVKVACEILDDGLVVTLIT